MNSNSPTPAPAPAGVLPRLKEPACWAAPAFIVLAASLVRPVGEFPILDDFDYCATARDFLRTGEIRLSDWPAMTLVGQAVWGAGFSAAFGDTFLSLRISTLVLHVVGSIAAYLWLRDRGASQTMCTFAVIALALNPETLYLACSFMTDAPGLAWTMLVLWTASRAVKSDSSSASAVAGVAAAVAYSFRQTTVIPLLGAVLVELYRWRRRSASLLFIPPFAVAIVHRSWLERHGVPHHVSLPMIHPFVVMNPGEMFARLARGSATVGLHLAPAAFLLTSRFNRAAWNRRGATIVLAVLVSTTTAALFAPNFIAYDNGVVFDCGLGADMSVARRYVLKSSTGSVAGDHASIFRIATSAIAVVSLTLAASACGGFRLKADPAAWHFRLTLLGSIAFAAISGSFYERYLIPVWSLGMLGIAAPARRITMPAAIVLLFFTSAGVAGAEDYFRRFNAAWDAFQDARGRGAPVESIDAGMEAAGEYQFNPRFRGKPERVRPFLANLSERERVEVIAPMVLNANAPHRATRPFLVAYAVVDEQVVKEFPYRSWVRSGAAYVLRRRQ